MYYDYYRVPFDGEDKRRCITVTDDGYYGCTDLYNFTRYYITKNLDELLSFILGEEEYGIEFLMRSGHPDQYCILRYNYETDGWGRYNPIDFVQRKSKDELYELLKENDATEMEKL